MHSNLTYMDTHFFIGNSFIRNLYTMYNVCLVPWRDIMSTVRGVQYHGGGGGNLLLFEYPR